MGDEMVKIIEELKLDTLPFFSIELFSYQNGTFIDYEPPGKQWYEEKLGKPRKSYYVAVE